MQEIELKHTIKKIGQRLKNRFTLHSSDKGFISSLYNELLQINTEKENYPKSRLKIYIEVSKNKIHRNKEACERILIIIN